MLIVEWLFRWFLVGLGLDGLVSVADGFVC